MEAGDLLKRKKPELVRRLGKHIKNAIQDTKRRNSSKSSSTRFFSGKNEKSEIYMCVCLEAINIAISQSYKQCSEFNRLITIPINKSLRVVIVNR